MRSIYLVGGVTATYEAATGWKSSVPVFAAHLTANCMPADATDEAEAVRLAIASYPPALCFDPTYTPPREALP